MNRFEKFEEWCENVDGKTEKKDKRWTCHLPENSGRVILDDRELYVEDESDGTSVDIRTGGTMVTQESGPFRHDRTNPPRESISQRSERDYFHGVDDPDVEDRRLTVGVEEDSMTISVWDRNTQTNPKSKYRT